MPVLRMILALGAGALIAGVLLIEAWRNQVPALPSHLQRSQTVEQHYDGYVKRVQAFYESLASALRLNAPHLIPLVEPPAPVRHGYRILPRILVDERPSEPPPRPRSAHYSWPWTTRLVDQAVGLVIDAEKELARVVSFGASAPQNSYEELVVKYRQFQKQQQNIDAHIQYNRLWQTAIAADRTRYDGETILHDAVLERQKISDLLNVDYPRDRGARAKGSPISTVRSPSDPSVGLRDRENRLARRIDQATAPAGTPHFVHVEQRNPRLVTVHVPFYTDIEEREFVQRVIGEIQRIWNLRDGDMEFRVELAMSYLRPEELYGTRTPPQAGETIEVYQHLNLFPSNGAILTTGAQTTHVYGRAIVLGPHDLTPRIIAHEFGHILGFKDLYFRGYKNLGRNGFTVMEVVADAGDIMGAPSTGLVLRRHFAGLINVSNASE